MPDIIRFLNDYSIEYITSGKNVGRNSVNVKCPKCGDPSFHLGIHLENGIFNCWRCNVSGNFVKLVNLLLNTSISKARYIAFKYGYGSSIKVKQSIHNYEASLPFELFDFYDIPSILEKYGKLVVSYLKARNCPSWFLPSCKLAYGKLLYGAAIPLFMCNKLVGYNIRFLVNTKKWSRYYLYKKEPVLFFYDHAAEKLRFNDTLCIVEGVFDVFALCDLYPTVGLLTSKITLEQISLLRELPFKKLYVILDGDDNKRKAKVEQIFTMLPFIKYKYDIVLPDGKDPANIGINNLKQLLESVSL